MRGLNLKKPTARPFANGGPVRGPGTGTSDEVPDEVPNGTYIMPTDSTQAIGEQNLAAMGAPGARGLPMAGGKNVPVQLSNGEFKLPPEQVHAVGVQALDQMKDATHSPTAHGLPGFQAKAKPEEATHAPTARGFAPANVRAMAKPEEPRQFFASGGVARGLPQRFADGGHVERLHLADAGIVTKQRLEEEGRPANTSVGLGAGPATAPAPAPKPATEPSASSGATFMPGVRNVYNESGKAIGDLAGQGRYAAAAGETARAALSYVPALADDVIGGAARAVGPAIMDAGSQFLGIGNATAAPAPAAAAPAKASVAAPVAAPPVVPAANPTDARLANGSQVSPGASTTPSTSGATATDAAPNQAMPGVYRNGNSYSDTAAGAALMTQPRGMPSDQNMAAADALAARSASPAVDQVATGRGLPGFVAAPTVRHSGNDWAARNALRNAEVSASSITNRGLGRGRTTPELQAYQQALATDAAMQQAEPAMEQAAMRENAGLQRETMRQDGETQRTGMRTAVDQQRVGIDSRRVATDERRANSEISARGLDIRAGQRQQDLQDRYAAAKTPEERAAIAQQVRDMSGRPHESPFKLHVTQATKNLDGSTNEGSAYVLNQQTGGVQQVGAKAGSSVSVTSQEQLAALPSGTLYTGPDGKQYRKN
jgi:hypothetical protein